jgi:DNA-binding response OmpR family regulator
MIEDDLDLGHSLQRAMKTEGLSCEWIRSIAGLSTPFDAQRYDCVLLDLTLPDGTGMDLLKRWRASGMKLPVIVITAKALLEDRLAGLDEGADDVIVKPFATLELVARIRAVLRRSARQASEVWAVGALEIEPRKFEARLGGVKLELSPREFRLILELAREPGAVVPKCELSQRLEPLGDPVDFGAIEVHVFNLRRKIGAERIQTVRGIGYLLAT